MLSYGQQFESKTTGIAGWDGCGEGKNREPKMTPDAGSGRTEAPWEGMQQLAGAAFKVEHQELGDKLMMW